MRTARARRRLRAYARARSAELSEKRSRCCPVACVAWQHGRYAARAGRRPPCGPGRGWPVHGCLERLAGQRSGSFFNPAVQISFYLLLMSDLPTVSRTGPPAERGGLLRRRRGRARRDERRRRRGRIGSPDGRLSHRGHRGVGGGAAGDPGVFLGAAGQAEHGVRHRAAPVAAPRERARGAHPDEDPDGGLAGDGPPERGAEPRLRHPARQAHRDRGRPPEPRRDPARPRAPGVGRPLLPLARRRRRPARRLHRALGHRLRRLARAQGRQRAHRPHDGPVRRRRAAGRDAAERHRHGLRRLPGHGGRARAQARRDSRPLGGGAADDAGGGRRRPARAPGHLLATSAAAPRTTSRTTSAPPSGAASRAGSRSRASPTSPRTSTISTTTPTRCRRCCATF